MLRHVPLVFLISLVATVGAVAQISLPQELSLTSGQLTRGADPVDGLYDPTQVHKMEITLAEPNWFVLLDGGRGPQGAEPVSLIGQLTFNDTLLLDSVVVSIKGQTSDFRNRSEKKSFKLEIDEYLNQDLLGYDNLNLNGGYEDASSMREMLYYATSRGFTHALKGAFVDLYINGDYWGPYSNIQQIEGTYIKEWFTDNSGTRWRADEPDGAGGGGGGGGDPFNTGFATLNDLGADSSAYTDYYTLKNTSSEDPWQQLIDLVGPLNSLPIEELYTGLDTLLDIDRTLWMLAQEIIFVDDDSYIFKGGMDYYVYYDGATDRMMTLEVDGNSVMATRNLNWGIFFNEDDARFPLLNRMLQNQQIRQRYLAHVRTILRDHFRPDLMNAQIDAFAALLDSRVQTDPKALFTYAEWQAGVQELRDFIQDRYDLLTALPSVDRPDPGPVTVSIATADGDRALAGSPTPVSLSLFESVQAVYVYYAVGTDGRYERIELLDDGQSGDGAAGDLTFAAQLPGQPGGSFVRYYYEVIDDDSFGTATYTPRQAEHTVYYYEVSLSGVVAEDVVINELMADNDSVVADGRGEFEDWVELFNTGATPADLGGHHLTDDLAGNPTKYTFPSGTVLQPGEYLIVWLDEDSVDSTPEELHANFRLSKTGESIHLLAADGTTVIDQTSFGALDTDVAWARSPNATGAFQVRTPTFNGNNDASNVGDLAASNRFEVFPNPAREQLTVRSQLPYQRLELSTLLGQCLVQVQASTSQLLLPDLPAGSYVLSAFAKTGEVVGRQLVVVR